MIDKPEFRMEERKQRRFGQQNREPTVEQDAVTLLKCMIKNAMEKRIKNQLAVEQNNESKEEELKMEV